MESWSLVNSTLAPGWSVEEVRVLKAAIMRFGIGRWRKILSCGCLPGKTSSQLSSQTQRLLGQQSLAEYMHLNLDIDKVAVYNHSRTGVQRKANCIVNTGKNPDQAELQSLKEFNLSNFGIPRSQAKRIKIPVMSPLASILASNLDPLTKLEQLYEQRSKTLKRLKVLEESSK
jgi:hypothetical protein